MLLLLVPGLPATDGTINHRRLSVNAKRKERERKREERGGRAGGHRGCERRSEVKPRGFPTVCARVASLCRSSGECERRNRQLKWFFRALLPSHCCPEETQKLKQKINILIIVSENSILIKATILPPSPSKRKILIEYVDMH